MSYGLIASKSTSVMVKSHATTVVDPADDDGSAEAMFDRFLTTWGAIWVPGRLSLTSLRLTFVPQRLRAGTARFEVHLREVTGVEISEGVLTRTVTVRTPTHVLYVRLTARGAATFAGQVAVAREAVQQASHPQ